jgi:hypothetical protein
MSQHTEAEPPVSSLSYPDLLRKQDELLGQMQPFITQLDEITRRLGMLQQHAKYYDASTPLLSRKPNTLHLPSEILKVQAARGLLDVLENFRDGLGHWEESSQGRIAYGFWSVANGMVGDARACDIQIKVLRIDEQLGVVDPRVVSDGFRGNPNQYVVTELNIRREEGYGVKPVYLELDTHSIDWHNMAKSTEGPIEITTPPYGQAGERITLVLHPALEAVEYYRPSKDRTHMSHVPEEKAERVMAALIKGYFHK